MHFENVLLRAVRANHYVDEAWEEEMWRSGFLCQEGVGARGRPSIEEVPS